MMNSELSDNRLWHAAVVMPRHEKKVREKLLQLGYEACVPSHKKVFIPCIVFIRLNDEERNLIVNFPFIKKFLVNKALPKNKVGRAVHPFATFTDQQMEAIQNRMEAASISAELATLYPLETIESLTH